MGVHVCVLQPRLLCSDTLIADFGLEEFRKKNYLVLCKVPTHSAPQCISAAVLISPLHWQVRRSEVKAETSEHRSVETLSVKGLICHPAISRHVSSLEWDAIHK